MLLRATGSRWCLIRPSSRERCFTADSCCQEKSPLIICWAVAIHICKSCRAPRNPELLGNVFHQHHVGLKITGNGTWELSDSGWYSLENSLRSFFSPFEHDFVKSNTSPMPISPLVPCQASVLKQQQIKFAASTPQTLVCPHVLVVTLWGDSVISSSLTLRASRFQPGQKWRSQVTEPIWERNSRRADQDCFN